MAHVYGGGALAARVCRRDAGPASAVRYVVAGAPPTSSLAAQRFSYRTRLHPVRERIISASAATAREMSMLPTASQCRLKVSAEMEINDSLMGCPGFAEDGMLAYCHRGVESEHCHQL